MLTDRHRPTTDQPDRPPRANWVFLGKRALPTDREARALERRGRRWLIVSYVLCPCHLPVTLGLLAVAFGGTTFGSVVLGHTVWVTTLLVALYALVLWQGFRRIRAAKALAARGLTIDCSTGACTVSDRTTR